MRICKWAGIGLLLLAQAAWTALPDGLELRLAAPRDGKPAPLLVVVAGGFWGQLDKRFVEAAEKALELTGQGVSVALLHPPATYPNAPAAVAQAIKVLHQQAGTLGIDPTRIYLAGHSSGAQAALLVALDPRYLGRYGLVPTKVLAGVISISGVHDIGLDRDDGGRVAEFANKVFAKDAQLRRRYSPIDHLGSAHPPLLVLSAQYDITGMAWDAKRFASAAKQAGKGSVLFQVVPKRSHLDVIALAREDNPARLILLDFVGAKPMLPALAQYIRLLNKWWLSPPFTTEPFWEWKDAVRSYDADTDLARRMNEVMERVTHGLSVLPRRRYHAIPLASLPALLGKTGRFIKTTNVRGETFYWDLKALAPYQPMLVVGIDDERNLFHYGRFYRAKRQYTWRDDLPTPYMFRPIGGMIHFRKRPPANMVPHYPAGFSIQRDGVDVVDENPWLAPGLVPTEMRKVFTWRNGCFACHMFKGVGAMAHHRTADGGEPHGGYALPLVQYPAQTWKTFIFEQPKAAAAIGAKPNMVPSEFRQALYEMVVAERKKLGNPPVSAPGY